MMKEIINPCPFCNHDQPEVVKRFQEESCTYIAGIYCPECRYCCMCVSDPFDDSGEALGAAIDVWNRKTFLEIFDEEVAKFHMNWKGAGNVGNQI